MKRAFIVIACAIALAACDEEPPPVIEQVRAIKTITVTEPASGDVRKYSGIVEATDISNLSFEVSGNVREVLVEQGARVDKGQILASLDPRPFELNVEAAQAELQRATANQSEKRMERERQQKLFDNGWASQAALDRAVAAAGTADADVDYARTKVSIAKRDLDKTILQAPFDGVIASREIDPFVEVQRGETAFQIFVENAMQVALSIPETVIGQIVIGQSAQVILPTRRGEVLEGSVSEIGSVADSANAFPVKVTMLEKPDNVQPGMTAEVAIMLGRDDIGSAFLIPLAAIVPGEGEPGGYVFVFDGETSTVRETPIRGSGVEGDYIAVEGLEAGAVIAVAGVSFLSDGQKVKLMTQ